MTQDDLQRWEYLDWKVAGPSEWAECLVAVDAGSIDPMFSEYISKVQREALEHNEALALAHEANAESWLIERSRRGDGALEHYAWMSALRAALPPDMEWAWEPKAERSGPLMIYWEDDGYGLRERGAGRDTFLQLDCNWQSRKLRFKLGASIKGSKIPLALAYEKALALLDARDGTWIAARPRRHAVRPAPLRGSICRRTTQRQLQTRCTKLTAACGWPKLAFETPLDLHRGPAVRIGARPQVMSIEVV